MKPRSLLSALLSTATVVVVRPAAGLSLFGFGSSSGTGGSSNSAEDAKARAAAVALIRENAAVDEFVPPAVGVGRRDAARFAAARSSGKLVCSSSGSGDATQATAATTAAAVSWDRINDDFCDCPHDGSDEPGTSACSNGESRVFVVLLVSVGSSLVSPVWPRLVRGDLTETV